MNMRVYMCVCILSLFCLFSSFPEVVKYLEFMDASDVCPTEDAIQAFLDHLVDPILPAKSSLRDNPSLSQQESVAKQVSVSYYICCFLCV